MGNRLKQIKKDIETFLIWWGRELMGLVPDGLRGLLLPDETTVQLLFGEKKTEFIIPTEGAEKTKIFDFAFPEILEEDAFKKFLTENVAHPVTIILSEGLILEREITLPKAAKANFRNIVKLQLPRLLPMAEQDIYYDFLSFEEEQSEIISVSVGMIKRTLEKQLTAVFAETDHRIKAINGLSRSNKELTFNFLNLGKKYKDMESRVVTGLGASFLGLILLFTTIHYFQLSERETFLAEQMGELSTKARAVETLTSEIQNFDQQQKLYQSKIEYLRLDEILSNLTDLLPDDSWVFDLTKNGNRLAISGKTSNASLLVEKIDKSPLFKNVTNSSSSIRDPSSNMTRERFSISFELEGGENK